MAIIQPGLPKPKESGGLLGSIGAGLAAAAGILGAVPTGGASLPLAAGATGVLSTVSKYADKAEKVGNAIQKLGNAVDPATTTTPASSGVTPLQSMENDPRVQLARMSDFDNAIKNSTGLIPQDEYSTLSKLSKDTRQALMQRLGRA